MVVAMIALVLAASGTAIAATKLVSGDKLIKKGSLSGNRLRKHTLTGTQINLKKLGKVPSAKNADFANSAGSATSATSATNATNATNADTVGGQAPSAFEPAADVMRSGLVKAASGQTVSLASFGPFTLTLKCAAGSSNSVLAEIDATSTEANSDGYFTQMAVAGQTYDVLQANGAATTTFAESDDNAANFFTPSGKTYIADLTVGQNYLGAQCYANALVSPS